MRTYAKGYRNENLLQHELHRRGWAVMRAPRSGRIGIPSPDLVAIRNGRVLVIECKAREGAFKVEADQLEQLKDWQKRAGAEPWLGWKLSRKEWKFLTLDCLLERNGNVGKRLLEQRGISLEQLDKA